MAFTQHITRARWRGPPSREAEGEKKSVRAPCCKPRAVKSGDKGELPCEGQMEILHGYIGLIFLVKLGEAVKYSKSQGKREQT